MQCKLCCSWPRKTFFMLLTDNELHIYIIGRYNPSVRIDVVSHTTYVVCINFIHKWRDLQFKIDSEQDFLRNFMAILFAHSVFGRNLLRGTRRRNTFCILFWCLAWGSNLAFTSNKPIHYLLDHGDFKNMWETNLGSRLKGRKDQLRM